MVSSMVLVLLAGGIAALLAGGGADLGERLTGNVARLEDAR